MINDHERCSEKYNFFFFFLAVGILLNRHRHQRVKNNGLKDFLPIIISLEDQELRQLFNARYYDRDY